jgi:hypothetical protein
MMEMGCGCPGGTNEGGQEGRAALKAATLEWVGQQLGEVGRLRRRALASETLKVRDMARRNSPGRAPNQTLASTATARTQGLFPSSVNANSTICICESMKPLNFS